MKRWLEMGLFMLAIMSLVACAVVPQSPFHRSVHQVANEAKAKVKEVNPKAVKTCHFLKERPGEITLATYRYQGDRVLQQRTQTIVAYSQLGYGNRYAAMKDSTITKIVKDHQGIKGLKHQVRYEDHYLVETVTVDYRKANEKKIKQAFPTFSLKGNGQGVSFKQTSRYLLNHHFKQAKKPVLKDLTQGLEKIEASSNRIKQLRERLKAKMQPKRIQVYQRGAMEKGQMEEVQVASEGDGPIQALEWTVFKSYQSSTSKQRDSDQKKWQDLIRRLNQLDGAGGKGQLTAKETRLSMILDGEKVQLDQLKKLDFFKQWPLTDSKLKAKDFKNWLKRQGYEEVTVDGLKAFEGD